MTGDQGAYRERTADLLRADAVHWQGVRDAAHAEALAEGTTRTSALVRAELDRLITRERTAAQVGAIQPTDRKALADRAEAAWALMYPALAELRDQMASPAGCAR